MRWWVQKKSLTSIYCNPTQVVTERYLGTLDLAAPEERVTVVQLKAAINLSNSTFAD